MNIGNIGTAMVTPFTKDGGMVDYKHLAGMIEHLIKTGTDTIVVLGTTGEVPTLSTEEKLDVLKYTVDQVNGRVPVIAGVGDNETYYSKIMAQKAEVAGVDGVMLVAPYYNKPNQRGIYAHFADIAQSVSVPVMLYNIPGRTGINIEPDTVAKLSKIPNIQIIKEASGDLDQMTEILSLTDDDFTVYSGDDGITLPLLAAGGHGVISVAAHVVGEDMQRMISLFKEGRHAEAAKIHQALLPLIRALFAQPSPAPVKYALSKLGLCNENVRLPIVSLTDEEKVAFDQVWDHYFQTQKTFA
ncbi:MAG: 4-hydroxy-tetrahydrodipicolinate synthase [Kurthia gibsonii]|uniref:4-hydroxy-tetrahydrodipicolinate synthase n=1 Tax=Kurthia gibsonii TaxID=33946 RepID=A0ABU9LHR9_9BACL|nr:MULTISPECIES: 4-hydroxy-tetrahydrodipicolinate synthase [Kurthia]AMA61753.1 4-hydroxy-tetrahydrodipicolinate synthase [Kurthia sp. 11kri321]RXH52992.1 4-hydroxy-tetrahydrodipicolinate synthase [Kurthia gibsonii]